MLNSINKRENESHHDTIVKQFADKLIRYGYQDVKADIPGYKSPGVLYYKGERHGYIPDIIVGIDSIHVIFEVETEDSIDDEHTRLQWKCFSYYARLKTFSFMVIVPTGCEWKARHRLNELGIESLVLPFTVNAN